MPAAGLPDDLVTWFFVLNLGAVVLVVFGCSTTSWASATTPGALRDAAAQHPAARDLGGAEDQHAIAEQFDEASILFADVVDFTPMAARMTPLSLVELLNDVFQCFDALVERFDLEKIKTIGDCYMVAAGARRRADHARVLVQLALDVQQAVASQPFGGRRLAFRIGIN